MSLSFTRGKFAFGIMAMAMAMAMSLGATAAVHEINTDGVESVVTLTGTTFGPGPSVAFFDDFQAGAEGEQLKAENVRAGTFSRHSAPSFENTLCDECHVTKRPINYFLTPMVSCISVARLSCQGMNRSQMS